MRWKVTMKRQNNFGLFKEMARTIKADELYWPRVNKLTQLQQIIYERGKWNSPNIEARNLSGEDRNAKVHLKSEGVGVTSRRMRPFGDSIFFVLVHHPT